MYMKSTCCHNVYPSVSQDQASCSNDLIYPILEIHSPPDSTIILTHTRLIRCVVTRLRHCFG